MTMPIPYLCLYPCLCPCSCPCMCTCQCPHPCPDNLTTMWLFFFFFSFDHCQMKLVDAETQYSMTNKAQTELFELKRKLKHALTRQWQTRKDKIVATLGTDLTSAEYSKIIEVNKCILLYNLPFDTFCVLHFHFFFLFLASYFNLLPTRYWCSFVLNIVFFFFF